MKIYSLIFICTIVVIIGGGQVDGVEQSVLIEPIVKHIDSYYKSEKISKNIQSEYIQSSKKSFLRIGELANVSFDDTQLWEDCAIFFRKENNDFFTNQVQTGVYQKKDGQCIRTKELKGNSILKQAGSFYVPDFSQQKLIAKALSSVIKEKPQGATFAITKDMVVVIIQKNGAITALGKIDVFKSPREGFTTKEASAIQKLFSLNRSIENQEAKGVKEKFLNGHIGEVKKIEILKWQKMYQQSIDNSAYKVSFFNPVSWIRSALYSLGLIKSDQMNAIDNQIKDAFNIMTPFEQATYENLLIVEGVDVVSFFTSETKIDAQNLFPSLLNDSKVLIKFPGEKEIAFEYTPEKDFSTEIIRFLKKEKNRNIVTHTVEAENIKFLSAKDEQFSNVTVKYETVIEGKIGFVEMAVSYQNDTITPLGYQVTVEDAMTGEKNIYERKVYEAHFESETIQPKIKALQRIFGDDVLFYVQASTTQTTTETQPKWVLNSSSVDMKKDDKKIFTMLNDEAGGKDKLVYSTSSEGTIQLGMGVKVSSGYLFLSVEGSKKTTYQKWIPGINSKEESETGVIAISFSPSEKGFEKGGGVSVSLSENQVRHTTTGSLNTLVYVPEIQEYVNVNVPVDYEKLTRSNVLQVAAFVPVPTLDGVLLGLEARVHREEKKITLKEAIMQLYYNSRDDNMKIGFQANVRRKEDGNLGVLGNIEIVFRFGGKSSKKIIEYYNQFYRNTFGTVESSDEISTAFDQYKKQESIAKDVCKQLLELSQEKKILGRTDNGIAQTISTYIQRLENDTTVSEIVFNREMTNLSESLNLLANFKKNNKLSDTQYDIFITSLVNKYKFSRAPVFFKNMKQYLAVKVQDGNYSLARN